MISVEAAAVAAPCCANTIFKNTNTYVLQMLPQPDDDADDDDNDS